MCVAKERRKDMHLDLAAGGRGRICAIRGVSNNELTNWDGTKKNNGCGFS